MVNGPVDPGADTHRIAVPGEGSSGPSGQSGPSGPPAARPSERRPALVAAAALVIAIVASLVFAATRPPAGPSASPIGPSASPSPTATSAASPSISPTPGASATAEPTPTASPVPSPAFLAGKADLMDRAAMAAQGIAPYKAAVDDLMSWAKGAVHDKPHPVTSLRIDGTKGAFVDDTATAYGLALAYVVTGDDTYGKAAARFIMAWVDTMDRTRNTCPNDGACQTSLIIGRTAPGFVFAADLLDGSGLLTDAQVTRFRAWLRNVILPTASQLTNNWGDTGTFTRVAITVYLGDARGFAAATAKWRSLMDLVPSDGHIPAEVARGRAGMGYTQEALDYKLATALIAERHGVDLWSYVGARGGSLKKAVDYIAKYLRNKSGWPWYGNVRRWPPSAMWELAYAHWHDSKYARLVAEVRPYGVAGHSAVRWTTLTNGLPLGS